MKTLAGKLVSVATLVLATTPLVSLAQNVVSPPSANRSIDRLTLLPGPYLLSPARPAAQPAPVLFLGPSPGYPFLSGVTFSGGKGLIRSGSGTLTLGGTTFSPEGGRKDPGLAPRNSPHPTSDTLRFESTLHAPPVPGEIRFVPAPMP